MPKDKKTKKNKTSNRENYSMIEDKISQNIPMIQPVTREPRRTTRNSKAKINQDSSSITNNIFSNYQSNNLHTNISNIQMSNNNSSLTNNISQAINPRNRYTLKVDIPTLEESFSKTHTNNSNNIIQSNNFLEEISRSINEVNEYPIKSTFGGNKKKSFFNF
jgi:hypothetical protein